MKSPKTLLRRSSAGLGLYAGEEIKKGQFIIEYVGPFLSEEEADKKGGKYLFEIAKDKTIDGTARTNRARYLNHSCRPNCEAEIKGDRVIISARRRILLGEELCYDYGKEYFNEFIKPHGCRCAKCQS